MSIHCGLRIADCGFNRTGHREHRVPIRNRASFSASFAFFAVLFDSEDLDGRVRRRDADGRDRDGRPQKVANDWVDQRRGAVDCTRGRVCSPDDRKWRRERKAEAPIRARAMVDGSGTWPALDSGESIKLKL